MAKRIVITGYYGFGNAGDDAILQTVVARLRTARPGSEIVVVPYPGGDLEAVGRLVAAETVSGSEIETVLAMVTDAELLIIGGGGLIQDYLPIDPSTRFTPRYADLAFWTTLAIAARTHGVPVTGWALGVGPLDTAVGRAEAALLFAQMGMVTVRDRASADLVRTLGNHRVEVTADPVYLAEPADTGLLDRLTRVDDLPRTGTIRVGVTLRRWEGADVAVLAGQLDILAERLDADIIFVPFQQSRRGLDHDALIATKVAAAMTRRERRGVIVSELTPEEKGQVLAACDLVVTMRLHAAILAAVAHRPVLAIAYDPKVSQAMEDLGRGEAVLAMNRLGDLADLAVEVHRNGVGDIHLEALARLRRRAALTETLVFDSPVPDPDPITLEALAETATNLSAALTVSERRIEGLHREIARGKEMTAAYAELERRHHELYDSKAMRIARGVWTARDRLGTMARRPPPPVKTPPVETTRNDLERIVASHPDAPRFVVLPPSIGWDVDLFQRPQQIALAFARFGYPVLYHLERPAATPGYLDRGDGVFVGHLPPGREDLLRIVPRPLFLSYVYNFAWKEHLQDPVTVYEHIDHLEVFEHVYPRADLEDWHRQALAEAGVVAASAMDLLDEVRGERPDAILVPNGVDYDHFAGVTGRRPDDLGEGPVVGYYGALAEWLDYDLIEGVSEALPDVRFVLIGPDYDGTATTAPALKRPNTTWLGPRPYRDLPAYLAGFDVAWIPFVVNDVTQAVSPLKLFEYMAGGKPIVTPPLRECARYRAVQIADGVEGFAAEIGRALELGKDPAHVDALRKTARANTWEARVRTIIEAVG